MRFSILEVDGEDFVMARGNDLSPALGHRMESRRAFRLPIEQSFSQYALRMDRTFWSGQLSEDQRFTRHERADSGREYESIVSVPVRIHGADPDGVFNVIATSQNAFTSVDRTYINLLEAPLLMLRELQLPIECATSFAGKNKGTIEMKHLSANASSAPPERDQFRKLVENKITIDEYVRDLERRAEESRHEGAPSPSPKDG